MITPRRSRQELFYFGALLVGTVVPLSSIVPWFVDNGLNIPLFVTTLFENPVSSYFGLDVIISILILWSMCVIDKALPTRDRVMIGLFSILGSSVGIPAFLWVRARHSRRTHPVDG
ncbi:DUF2834 domain-containing protein [Gordonia malaquae]|uniref:DUF2834 domain-containing protein n=1 Tax=Gordonia malaquae TaxID=410332 RepID=UPI0030FF0ED6